MTGNERRLTEGNEENEGGIGEESGREFWTGLTGLTGWDGSGMGKGVWSG